MNLLKKYERYLRLAGYAESTVKKRVKLAQYLLDWCEKSSIPELDKVLLDNYLEHLQKRNLSENTIAGSLSSLKNFAIFLRKTGLKVFDTDIKLQKPDTPEREILSINEVKSLYNACESDIYGIRDRAILSLYYGCGLRRTEGLNLNIKDIDFLQNTLFVSRGKGNKQRYIPLNKQVKDDLRNYLLNARHFFEKEENPAFLLSLQGKRIARNTVVNRFKKLLNNTLPTKEIGLHSLRHSIATHLLQSGMNIENLRKFLGHSSLETTQIYLKVVDSG